MLSWQCCRELIVILLFLNYLHPNINLLSLSSSVYIYHSDVTESTMVFYVFGDFWVVGTSLVRVGI